MVARKVRLIAAAVVSCAVLAAVSPVAAPDSPAPAPAPSPAAPSTTVPVPLLRTPDWRTPITTSTTTTTTTAAPQVATAPPPVPPVCGLTQYMEFIDTLLAPHGIPSPGVLVGDNVKRSGYVAGSGTLVVSRCDTFSGIAHEVGHYVHDRAFGFDWSAAQRDAAENFTGTNWLKQSESSPGIERAAHCIGYILWQSGTYTRCPDPAMVAHASVIVSRV